jgi:uncharacterized membrane protein YkvA (DUF1232 family)
VALRRMRSKATGRKAASKVLRSLPHFIKLLGRLFRDSRVARVDKVLAGLAIAYILTPADLIPDFLGFMGMVDDVYLLGLALNRLIGRAGMDVVLEHWSGSGKALHALMDGLEDIGSLLPGPVRGAVQRYVQRSMRAIA